jgi:hypothetical protein
MLTDGHGKCSKFLNFSRASGIAASALHATPQPMFYLMQKYLRGNPFYLLFTRQLPFRRCHFFFLAPAPAATLHCHKLFCLFMHIKRVAHRSTMAKRATKKQAIGLTASKISEADLSKAKAEGDTSILHH